jgi:flagellar M-ring protein FliF
VYRDVGGRQAFAPRDKAELDRFAELIKSAVGFDAARGDIIQIDTAEFARTPESAMSADFNNPGSKYTKWIPYAIGVGGALLLLMIVLLVRRGGKSAGQSAAEQTLAELAAASDTIAIEGGRPLRALPKAKNREESHAIRGEAIELAAKDPATAAMILREWLNAPSGAAAPPAHF